ncbi:MAG: hypothetical protein OCC45_04640 [Desulfotalea sp.]
MPINIPIKIKTVLYLPLFIALMNIAVGVHAVHPLLHPHEQASVHGHHDHDEMQSYIETSAHPAGHCPICEFLATTHLLASWSKEVIFSVVKYQNNYCSSKIELFLVCSSPNFIRGPPA